MYVNVMNDHLRSQNAVVVVNQANNNLFISKNGSAAAYPLVVAGAAPAAPLQQQHNFAVAVPAGRLPLQLQNPQRPQPADGMCLPNYLLRHVSNVAFQQQVILPEETRRIYDDLVFLFFLV